MKIDDFNRGLFTFLTASTTPYHAVENMKTILELEGFKELREGDSWKLTDSSRYFVSRGDSSLAAFVYRTDMVEKGIRIAGAHTDSPALKVKPNPDMHRNSYLQVGVEVYGGALLNPWFDRELSLAGRVTFKGKGGALETGLVDFKRPVAVIPSLAIHLHRDANKKHSVNAQKDLPPVIMQCFDDKPSLDNILRDEMNSKNPGRVKEIISHDLFFYDGTAPSRWGVNGEFITGSRLDNLLSCFAGIMGICDSKNDEPVLVIFNDHEEAGSVSDVGAQGPFLKAILQRISGDLESYYRVADRSSMISMDNAHGIHPNFADKYDAEHGPLLNSGPVIKRNANQRYATVAHTEALFKEIAEGEDIPVQSFVVRSDMACGSTIGPLTAAQTGIKTIDVGVPTWAMHSIRETAGEKDLYWLYKIIKKYFEKGSD